MDQPEFISIPHQDQIHGKFIGGVKTTEEFFTPENIKNICRAIEEFPKALNSLNRKKKYDGSEFSFEFSKDFLKGATLKDQSQSIAVHITHSLVPNNKPEYIEKLREFLNSQRSQKATFVNNKLVVTSQAQAFKDEFPNSILDQTLPPNTIGRSPITNRDVYQPIFKMPRDYFYDDSLQKNPYIQQVIEQKVLAPTSNTVRDTVNEVKVYEALLKQLDKEIQKRQQENPIKKQPKSDQQPLTIKEQKIQTLLLGKANNLDRLILSKEILQNTINGLKNEMLRAVNTVNEKEQGLDFKPIRDYPGLVTFTKDSKPVDLFNKGEIAIFDSFDEKLKQIGLCEHRAGGSIRKDFHELLELHQGKGRANNNI